MQTQQRRPNPRLDTGRQAWAPSVRRHVGPAVITLGATIAIVASFAHWVRSGSVSRSSYEMLDLVHLLRINRIGWIRLFIRAWPLMPLLVVGAAAAAWWGTRYTAGALGLFGGVYAAALSGAVALKAHDRYRVVVSSAPSWTAFGACIVVVGAVIVLVGVAPTHPDSRQTV